MARKGRRSGKRKQLPTESKAAEMLEHPPHGKPLSKKQRGLFGMLASGKKPDRMSEEMHE